MHQFYLGIDLHLKRTYAVLMNNTGEVVDKRRIRNKEFGKYLQEVVPRETYAVIEATRNWTFAYDLLREHVERTELAHPKELRMIASAVVKDDPIDAKVLADLARLNFLPIAYAAPKEVRDLRQWIRHREWLIGHRTQAKNRIHAALANYNLVSPVRDLFGVTGREYIEQALGSVRLATRRVIQDNLELIDYLSDQIKALEDDIPLEPEQELTIKLLKTIPGVGKINAVTILAEIGDYQRFSSHKALCNWAGLTPKVHKSDQFVRHGRISKQGSPYLRGAMTRAASVASRSSKRWYRVHENMLPRCGRAGAKVAVARRLLTVVYYMLMRQEPYQENYPSKKDR